MRSFVAVSCSDERENKGGTSPPRPATDAPHSRETASPWSCPPIVYRAPARCVNEGCGRMMGGGGATHLNLRHKRLCSGVQRLHERCLGGQRRLHRSALLSKARASVRVRIAPHTNRDAHERSSGAANGRHRKRHGLALRARRGLLNRRTCPIQRARRTCHGFVASAARKFAASYFACGGSGRGIDAAREIAHHAAPSKHTLKQQAGMHLPIPRVAPPLARRDQRHAWHRRARQRTQLAELSAPTANGRGCPPPPPIHQRRAWPHPHAA